MHAGHAADDSPVLDHRMSCNHRRVRHDDTVTDYAVMCDMGIGHKQTVVADAGFLALTCSPMNRSTLTDGRTVTDEYIALFAFKFQVLRLFAYRSALEYTAIPADAGPATDDYMRADLRSFPDLHILPNDGIRSDLNILSYVRPRMDNRSFMYICDNLVVSSHGFQLL